MANINDYVSVVVSLQATRTIASVNLKTPLVAAYHTHYADIVRAYTSPAALVADGFTVNEPAYLAASILFAGGCQSVLVGRRALPPLQVLTFTCTSTSTADTYVGTFVDSAGVSHALSVASTGVPATDATTIRAAITAFTLVGCTVSGTGALVTLTQTAGHMVDVQGWSTQVFQLADATPDPGIATDLAAIVTANPLGWYGLVLDSNSKAEVLAASAWVEATGQGGKVGFFETRDFAVANAISGNVQLAMKAAGYQRSSAPYTGKRVLNYLGAAVCAGYLTHTPGAWTAAAKGFSGPTVDDDKSLTETQALNINTETVSSPGTGGQNGNYYRTVANLSWFFPGVAPGGNWLDQTIGTDALQVSAQAALASYIASQDKVPFDDFGINSIVSVIKGAMRAFMTPPKGTGTQLALLDGTIDLVTTVPTAASFTAAQRASRNLTGISVAGVFTNAVNTVGVVINVSN